LTAPAAQRESTLSHMATNRNDAQKHGDYLREWRARPENRERENRRNRSYGRALIRLKQKFPDEFRKLYLRQLKADGIKLGPSGRPPQSGA